MNVTDFKCHSIRHRAFRNGLEDGQAPAGDAASATMLICHLSSDGWFAGPKSVVASIRNQIRSPPG